MFYTRNENAIVHLGIKEDETLGYYIPKTFFVEKIGEDGADIYIDKQNIVMGIFKDITKEEKEQENLYDLRVETMEMAQKVIDKQMRIVQEIASLLGETAAETKIALTKLKESISDE